MASKEKHVARSHKSTHRLDAQKDWFFGYRARMSYYAHLMKAEKEAFAQKASEDPEE